MGVKMFALPLVLLAFSSVLGALVDVDSNGFLSSGGGVVVGVGDDPYGDSNWLGEADLGYAINGSGFYNGSSADYQVDGGSGVIDVSLLAGLLTVVTVGAGIAVVCSLNFFGSGQNSAGTVIVFKTVVLFGLWGVLSFTALEMLLLFPWLSGLLCCPK